MCHIPRRPLTLTAIKTEWSLPLWNNKACIGRFWQCNGSRTLSEQFQNCRTVILKPLVTLVMVTAFLLQGLHPFLYYPHVICKARPNQWLREDELLRPMMCTGKIPDRCIKKWVLNRWQFSNQRLCSSQQTDQMENSVCELFCSTQRYWPDCICTLVQDQEVATPDAASQTTSALFVLLFVCFFPKLAVVRNSYYTCSLFHYYMVSELICVCG